MLATLKEILEIAQARGCAVGSFNTPNLESVQAVIGAAEELGEPVIIMHAQVHEEMGLVRMEDIADVMLLKAEKAKVPVCVHLDHGTDVDYVKRGMELGFTSVMYDGSTLPLTENYGNTCAVVELAHKMGISVEAEVGFMGAREGGGAGGESIYTDPAEAKRFVESTGIDALACAFGTAHGLYLKQPKLDFVRLAEIRKLVNVPLVMHGGSGVSGENYCIAIAAGIRKINYYSYMAKAGGTAVDALVDRTFFHDIAVAAQQGMREDVKKAMRVFALK